MHFLKQQAALSRNTDVDLITLLLPYYYAKYSKRECSASVFYCTMQKY